MKASLSIRGYDNFTIHTLFFGVAAGFLFPSFMIRSTTGSYWIPSAVWIAAAILSSWLYRNLLAMLQGRTLLGEIRSSIGRLATTVLSLPILLFLYGAVIVLLRAYSEIVSMTMLPTTPIPFLNGMLLAPALLAFAGMMPIFRSAKVLFLIGLLLCVSLLLIGLSDINWTLGKPWLYTDGDFFINQNFYSGSFLWVGFSITAFIGRYTRQSARIAWKSYVAALIFSLPFIAGYIYLPIMTFGREFSSLLTVPFVSKMDSIYKYWIIVENLAAVFVSAMMLHVLIIMALKLHSCGSVCQELLPTADKRLIYIVLILLVYAGATWLPSWRDLERSLFLTVGIRTYIMFVFPMLGIAALHVARKRREAGRPA
jgi:hypothetical protein